MNSAVQEFCSCCGHMLNVPHLGFRDAGRPFCSKGCAFSRSQTPCVCNACIKRRKLLSINGDFQDIDIIEVVSVALLATLSQNVSNSTEMGNNFLKSLRKQGCDIIRLTSLPVDKRHAAEVLSSIKRG